MSFADNLKKVRKSKNISQEDLAEMLNVSRQAVSKWEQGIGYPEVEKLLILSQKLNLSLDYLMLGVKPVVDEAKEKETNTNSYSGKISIKSYDGKSISYYYRFFASPVYRAKEDEPSFVLIGVSQGSFWGESSTLLGWYAREEDIQCEINAIHEAIKKGENSYNLQYASKVKKKLLRVKLEQN